MRLVIIAAIVLTGCTLNEAALQQGLQSLANTPIYQYEQALDFYNKQCVFMRPSDGAVLTKTVPNGYPCVY